MRIGYACPSLLQPHCRSIPRSVLNSLDLRAWTENAPPLVKTFDNLPCCWGRQGAELGHSRSRHALQGEIVAHVVIASDTFLSTQMVPTRYRRTNDNWNDLEKPRQVLVERPNHQLIVRRSPGVIILFHPSRGSGYFLEGFYRVSFCDARAPDPLGTSIFHAMRDLQLSGCNSPL